jgi:hypothetical protein
MKFDELPAVWLVICGAVYSAGLVVCLVVAGGGFTAGFAFGGALVLANAWVSARRLKKAKFSNRTQAMVTVLGGFFVRLSVLAVCLYALIKFVRVDPVGLVAGLSVVPAGVLVLLILIYIANRRPEEI